VLKWLQVLRLHRIAIFNGGGSGTMSFANRPMSKQEK